MVKALFAATLLLSSALLFLVQPMFGKLVLPHVGATPAAWTTCMLFFQTALLVGYAYAHLVRVPPFVHVALLAVALAALPVGLGSGGAPPPAGGDPTWWLLGHLARGAGPVFLALATSAPVLGRWFPGAPYGLYAASNAGSLAALLAYPLVVEPWLPLAEQARALSIGYAAFVVLVGACGVVAWRHRRGAPAPTAAPGASLAVDARTTWRWVGLAFVPSSLMLGATTYVSTDIASMPLMWVVPLALYLVTFIIVFARPPARPAPVVVTAFMLLLLPLFFLSLTPVSSGPVLLLMHVGLLFFAGLLFHGELARTAPPPAALTRFYLAMAAGGALGGLWNAAAPLLFTGLTEYPITMVLACWLLPRAPTAAAAAPTSTGDRQRELLRAVGVDPATLTDLEPTADEVARRARRRDWVVPLGTFIAALGAGVLFQDAGGALRALAALAVPTFGCAFLSVRRPRRLALGLAGVLVAALLGAGQSPWIRHQDRSFFGVLRVDDAGGVRSMVHGTIIHGQQRRDPEHHLEPIAYYHPTGPIGDVFTTWRAQHPAGAAVAIVGLGTGALAAYGREGDRFTFYEIDAAVERVARDPRLFTWLAETPATIDVVLGDGRLALGAAAPGAFDLLIFDAFSSHAIPMHLVTREAVALYLSRLAPGGLVVMHISSPYLRLAPPLGALARDAGLFGLVRHDTDRDTPFKVPSTWVVLARTRADLGALADDPRWQPLPSGGRPWTDDFSDLLGAIAW